MVVFLDSCLYLSPSRIVFGRRHVVGADIHLPELPPRLCAFRLAGTETVDFAENELPRLAEFFEQTLRIESLVN
jgi:hypothetical protein